MHNREGSLLLATGDQHTGVAMMKQQMNVVSTLSVTSWRTTKRSNSINPQKSKQRHQLMSVSTTSPYVLDVSKYGQQSSTPLTRNWLGQELSISNSSLTVTLVNKVMEARGSSHANTAPPNVLVRIILILRFETCLTNNFESFKVTNKSNWISNLLNEN